MSTKDERPEDDAADLDPALELVVQSLMQSVADAITTATNKLGPEVGFPIVADNVFTILIDCARRKLGLNAKDYEILARLIYLLLVKYSKPLESDHRVVLFTPFTMLHQCRTMAGKPLDLPAN